MKRQDELENELYLGLKKRLEEDSKSKNEYDSIMSALQQQMMFVNTSRGEIQNAFKRADAAKKVLDSRTENHQLSISQEDFNHASPQSKF